MSTVGQRERLTQQQVLRFAQDRLDYRFLGDWIDQDSNRNVEVNILRGWLARQEHEERIVNRALRELAQGAATALVRYRSGELAKEPAQ